MTIDAETIIQAAAVMAALSAIAVFLRGLIAPIARKEADAAILADKEATEKAATKEGDAKRAEIANLKAQVEELERRAHTQDLAMTELRAIATPVAAALRDLQRHLMERP